MFVVITGDWWYIFSVANAVLWHHTFRHIVRVCKKDEGNRDCIAKIYKEEIMER